MPWGTIEANDGCVHVAPCDEDGDLIGGHILTKYCACGPRIERHIGAVRDLVVHDEPDGEESSTQH